LLPHPEGGYFAESYRALEGTADGRSVATAIYYLLKSGEFSAFHRLRSDELWHFYDGDGLTLYLIDAGGAGRLVELGRGRNAFLQALVPARTWIAARVTGTGAFSLCGCTVSPGFEFNDFELARRADLLASFPQHEKWIRELTVPGDPCGPDAAD